MAFWRSKGIHTNFVVHSDGSYSGYPGSTSQLSEIVHDLSSKQAKANSNPTTRAYQATYENVAEISALYFDSQIQKALEASPSVNFQYLEIACIFVT